MSASLGLALSIPGTANAATYPGSASVSSSYGMASATWTWGPGSANGIKLHVQDTNCNSNPVFAYFHVIRMGGKGEFDTPNKRYDYNGCNGKGTDHPDLKISDGFNIKSVAIVVCNEGLLSNSCKTGTAAANPLG
ncbi:hypothetical protein ACF09J_35210 [Streptomyces sp. NPDC014889]|uniref:hypothetical protein n=1 Tax=Streptomyces sp. NPDC014889 TaxID=3364928 RepID=UPI0036FE6AB7